MRGVPVPFSDARSGDEGRPPRCGQGKGTLGWTGLFQFGLVLVLADQQRAFRRLKCSGFKTLLANHDTLAQSNKPPLNIVLGRILC